jgi:hypothetical protein
VDDGFDAAPGFVVCVLPLRVVVVVGAGGVLGRGAGVEVRGVLRGVVRGVLRLAGRDVAGAGAAGWFAGTSLSCGWAAVSRFAIARSRFSVVSAPSAALSGACLGSDLQPASRPPAMSNETPMLRVYFVMKIPPESGE